MTSADPMPELCTHDDPSWCGPECDEKVRVFDEWVKRQIGKGGSIASLLEIVRSVS